MGAMWGLYMQTGVSYVTFINDGIQYQFPLLMIVIITKYIILMINGYKSSKKIFYLNLIVYALYLCGIIFINYRTLILQKLGM